MNAKIYNGNVQPNPKEYKIWVNDEGIIKTWNGTEWIELSGTSGGSGSGESGSGSGDEWVYLDLTNASNSIKIASMMITTLFKAVYTNRLSIIPASAVTSFGEEPLAAGIDVNLKVDIIEKSLSGDDIHITSVKDYIEFLNSSDIDFTPYKITESEFYNLEA